jgi:hypothetical protein
VEELSFIQPIWLAVGLLGRVSGLTIRIPVSKYIDAFTRDGTLIAPVRVGNDYVISVGFSPTYVIRSPRSSQEPPLPVQAGEGWDIPPVA